MGGEVVYRKSWFGTVKVLVFYLALLAMIVAWRPYSGLPDHLLLGGSSLSLLLLMLAQLTGSPHSVALTERGLEFRRWRKRSFVSWEDVAEVRVVRWVGKSGTLRPVSQAQLVSPEGATRRLHFVCTLAESAHGPSSALWRPATLPF